MKQVSLFILFILTLATAAVAKPALVRLELSDAIAKKMVNARAVSNGGYQGKGLRLQVTNLTGNQVLLTMDQGVIFQPYDTTEQHLTLAGLETLTLQPFKEGMVDVQTFCAAAHKSSPDKADSFRYWKKGNDALVKTLQYLKTKNLLNTELAQSAIWVITDNHDLSTLFEEGNPLAWAGLVDFMAGLTGKPKPAVFVKNTINANGEGPVFIPKVLKVKSTFEVKSEQESTVSIGIFNEAGAEVQNVIKNRKLAAKKGFRFGVDFEAKGASPGNYYIRLTKDGTIAEERKFTVQ